jgi:hypothetical protein
VMRSVSMSLPSMMRVVPVIVMRCAFIGSSLRL